MAFSIERIRQTAERVAASHALEIVEIEYLGGSKHRVLRVFIEQNAEQRARRAEQAKEETLLEHLGAEGVALDQLAWITHEDCESFSRDFGTVIDVEELVPVSEYTLEVSYKPLPPLRATATGWENSQR
jgi:ribosome maturation factor RimP